MVNWLSYIYLSFKVGQSVCKWPWLFSDHLTRQSAMKIFSSYTRRHTCESRLVRLLLLAYWSTGADGSLVHWSSRSLVHWSSRSLVHWFTGFWFTGSLVHRCRSGFTGPLVQMVHWFTGALVQMVY